MAFACLNHITHIVEKVDQILMEKVLIPKEKINK